MYSASKKVSSSDIVYSSKSILDDFGRVFFYEDRVFRAIPNCKKYYCLELLESTLFHKLSGRGLIAKTWVSDICFDNCDLVLEHERLTETLQHEWSFSMLKDAALMVLEVQDLCIEHGYELKDAHTQNVFFRGAQPVLIDIGSITKKKAVEVCEWAAYEEFLASFVLPLLFWEKNMIYIVRKLLESNFHRMATLPDQSIASSGLLKLLFPEIHTLRFRRLKLLTTKRKNGWLNVVTERVQASFKTYTGRQTKLFSYRNEKAATDLLSAYFPFRQISGLLYTLQRPMQTSVWCGYHTRNYSTDGSLTLSKRFFRIIELIKGLESQIVSVIDLAGNEGLVSRLIAERTSISKLIVADYDENAVDSAYSYVKNMGEERIQTVLLNFMFTSNLGETVRRLKCDLVLALAVTHHLLLTTGYSIDSIFERLKLFTNKFILVEFMPLGLWSGDQDVTISPPSWYNVDWFRFKFESYFDLILEEKLEVNRILFVGRLKF